jgi:hypothetical protein
MSLTAQLAKHLRDVHFGGNWTTSNLRDNLSDVTWEQAITKVHSFNTLATLLYHTNYFIEAASTVLRGEPLTANDKFSFDHPPIASQEDWEAMMSKAWADAEELATLVEQLPESRLWETFVDERYGTYFRNIEGIIEHTHYHLGQIVIIKKLIPQDVESSAVS